jgi:hypothetical protein
MKQLLTILAIFLLAAGFSFETLAVDAFDASKASEYAVSAAPPIRPPDKLDTVKDGKLEHYGKFFRAEAILVTEDESELNEALDLLASTPTGDPEFTFYAANRLLDNDRFEAA